MGAGGLDRCTRARGDHALGGRGTVDEQPTVPVAGTTYYRCGPNWFQKAYTGGQVSFVVVAPPPGY